jgi:hypothetical protein
MILSPGDAQEVIVRLSVETNGATPVLGEKRTL